MFGVQGLHGHIQRNNLKSTLLIFGFLGLFAILQTAIQATTLFAPELLLGPEAAKNFDGVFAAGPNAERILAEYKQTAKEPFSPIRLMRENALLFTVAFAAIYLIVATWWNGLYIRYAMRARPLSRSQQPELYNLVENLAITAGIPCPTIEVIESDNLNAYASGLTPAAGRIGVTTGLVRKLGRDELEAVLAHELTHIRYGDSRLMAITKACSDLVVSGIIKFVEQARAHPVQTALPFAILPFLGKGIFLVVVAVWCLAGLVTLAAYLAKAMILHSREFVADAGAIELTKNPAALISALRKIAGADDIGITNPAAQAMMFSGSAEGWLSTHPAIEARIEAIRLHGGSTVADEAAHRARGQRSVAPAARPAPAPSAAGLMARGRAGFAGAERAAPAQAFGRRRAHGMATEASVARASAVEQPQFGLQATPREVWREESVFSARHHQDGGSAGDSLFERWVMSGRLDRARNDAERAGKLVVSGVRWAIFTWLAAIMGFGLLMSVLTSGLMR